MQSKLVVLLNPYQFLLNLVILMVNPCTVLEFSDLKLLINYTHAARLVVSSRAAQAQLINGHSLHHSMRKDRQEKHLLSDTLVGDYA